MQPRKDANKENKAEKGLFKKMTKAARWLNSLVLVGLPQPLNVELFLGLAIKKGTNQ